ncbi:MAG: FliH/SctL family protein [Nitrospirota bacterium]
MSRIIQGHDLCDEIRPYTMESIAGGMQGAVNLEDAYPGAMDRGQDDKALSAEKEAFQRGYEAGEKAGVEAAKKRLEGAINGIVLLIEGLKDLNRQIYEEGEMKIVALAICIAEKVIHSELKQNPEIIVNVVRAALKKVLDREMLTIKVNPKDFEVLNRYRPELIASTNEKRGLTIEWDDSIMPGGCMIETNHGEVDARIDKQLEEISLDLKEEIERNGPRKEDR